MKLAGHVSVGPIDMGYPNFLVAELPTTLIYNWAARSGGVAAFGAYSNTLPRPSIDTKWPSQSLWESLDAESVGYGFNYSEAPLEDVVVAKIFHCKDGLVLRGLLFEYRNGSQRPLVSCRLGVDPCEVFESPQCVCIGVIKTERIPKPWASRIRFNDQPDHGHSDSGGQLWRCQEMMSTLRSIFSPRRLDLNVKDSTIEGESTL